MKLESTNIVSTCGAVTGTWSLITSTASRKLGISYKTCQSTLELNLGFPEKGIKMGYNEIRTLLERVAEVLMKNKKTEELGKLCQQAVEEGVGPKRVKTAVDVDTLMQVVDEVHGEHEFMTNKDRWKKIARLYNERKPEDQPRIEAGIALARAKENGYAPVKNGHKGKVALPVDVDLLKEVVADVESKKRVGGMSNLAFFAATEYNRRITPGTPEITPSVVLGRIKSAGIETQTKPAPRKRKVTENAN